jgi:hypothetical protein
LIAGAGGFEIDKIIERAININGPKTKKALSSSCFEYGAIVNE